MTAILRVKQIDGMKRCAGASEKVDNEGIGFVGYKETICLSGQTSFEKALPKKCFFVVKGNLSAVYLHIFVASTMCISFCIFLCGLT